VRVAGLLVGVVVGVVAGVVAGLGAGCDTLDPCADLLGGSRGQAESCLESLGGTLGPEAVYQDEGGAYTLAWADHGHYELDTGLIDICDDQGFDRELIVLRHVSGDPAVTGPRDEVVFHGRLRCEQKVHCDAPPEVLLREPQFSAGSSPLPMAVGCGDLTVDLIRPAEQVADEACYAERLCPAGTTCLAARTELECPATGSVCAPPGQAERYVDLDQDGVPDCDDPDADGDGLSNDAERAGVGRWITDPYRADTDGDGVGDAEDAYPTVGQCAEALWVADFSAEPFPDGAWEPLAGTWSWDGTSLECADATDTAKIWAPGTDFQDAVVVVRLRSGTPNDANIGVMTRVEDITADRNGGHYLQVGINPHNQRVTFGYANGEYHSLLRRAVSFAPDQLHTLVIEMQGPRYRIYLSDDERVPADAVPDIDQTAYDARGALGLRVRDAVVRYESVDVCR